MGGSMHLRTSAAGGTQTSASAPMTAQILLHPGAAESRRGNMSIN